MATARRQPREAPTRRATQGGKQRCEAKGSCGRGRPPPATEWVHLPYPTLPRLPGFSCAVASGWGSSSGGCQVRARWPPPSRTLGLRAPGARGPVRRAEPSAWPSAVALASPWGPVRPGAPRRGPGCESCRVAPRQAWRRPLARCAGDRQRPWAPRGQGRDPAPEPGAVRAPLGLSPLQPAPGTVEPGHGPGGCQARPVAQTCRWASVSSCWDWVPLRDPGVPVRVHGQRRRRRACRESRTPWAWWRGRVAAVSCVREMAKATGPQPLPGPGPAGPRAGPRVRTVPRQAPPHWTLTARYQRTRGGALPPPRTPAQEMAPVPQQGRWGPPYPGSRLPPPRGVHSTRGLHRWCRRRRRRPWRTMMVRAALALRVVPGSYS